MNKTIYFCSNMAFRDDTDHMMISVAEEAILYAYEKSKMTHIVIDVTLKPRATVFYRTHGRQLVFD